VSENLDLVRSIYADWARGNYRPADWVDPEIELVVPDGPGTGSWAGQAAMERYWRDFLDIWRDWRVEPESIREVDNERVMAMVSFAARGRTSGVQLGQIGARGANVFEIRDRKVIRLTLYWDRDHALADLGLPPESDLASG
jgi:ketosteroid isomerase-like protein